MKNSKIYSRLGELSLKYVNEGLTIDFEFNRFEMILRGCLDLSLTKYDVYIYNHAYSYEMIKSLSDDIDIETLVDEFKEEVFKQYKLSKKKAESEEDMISLTKIFDLLGNDTSVIIRAGEAKLYSGSVGKCTRDIWRNAYMKDMGFSDYLGKYIIYVVYRL